MPGSTAGGAVYRHRQRARGLPDPTGPITVMLLAFVLLASGIATVLLLGWHFAYYPALMGLVAARYDHHQPDPDVLPYASIVVPSYNEASVIGRRVRDLVDLEYPDDRYELVFVDSGSDDGTVGVLRDALADVESPRTSIVIEEERRGKGAAINEAISIAVGDMVLVTDANTTYDEGTLEAIASHFADPEVGAVTGGHAIPNTSDGLSNSNQLFYDLEELKARGESCIDSTCQLYGEISAWRPEIATAATDNLAEDLELSLRIRRQGYRIVHEPEAFAREPEPRTSEEQVVSKKRQFVGLIQSVARHWRFLSVPADRYRALIFPSRKLLQVLSPLLFAVAIAAVVGLALVGAWRTLGTYVLASGAATVVAVVAAFSVRSQVLSDAANGSASPRALLDALYFVVLMEYTIVLAWVDFLGGEYSVRWEKSSTDR